mmetsp:Transcript_19216/g.45959  ORF Transcript_19216/g.45959 Transcript_19216/m.45959 type:complete len:303 (+) Transcript_19216:49-957(+)
MREVSHLIVGPVGSKVTLGLSRHGRNHDVILTRKATPRDVSRESSRVTSVVSESSITSNDSSESIGESLSAPSVGVGITFALDPQGRYIVKRVLAGGPAESSAAVSPGDVVVAISGTPITGLSTQQLALLVVGPEGSRVTLDIERQSGGATQVSLLRRPTLSSPSSSSSAMRDMSGGLGISFHQDRTGRFVVKRLVPGGSAERSGRVNAGDVLIGIGSTAAQGLSQRELSRLLVGPPGSTADLRLQAPGSTPRVVPVVRSVTPRERTTPPARPISAPVSSGQLSALQKALTKQQRETLLYAM